MSTATNKAADNIFETIFHELKRVREICIDRYTCVSLIFSSVIACSSPTREPTGRFSCPDIPSRLNYTKVRIHRSRHWALFWAKCSRGTLSYFISLRRLLILKTTGLMDFSGVRNSKQLENRTFKKLDLFPSSGKGRETLRQAIALGSF
jgi:hypothetical protein